MKYTYFLFASALLSLASCGSDAQSGEATDISADSGNAYSISVDQSVVGWTGTKVVGMGSHSGTFGIAEGSLTVDSGSLVGGTLTLDLTNIVCTDTASWMTEELKGKLVGHLKDTSFLFVAEHPTALFEIASVEALEVADDQGNSHNITGNLTLRGETRSISFPAHVEVSDAGVQASGVATINRLDWGINYDKEKMSLSDKLKASVQNGIVGENVEISFSLTAAK